MLRQFHPAVFLYSTSLETQHSLQKCLRTQILPIISSLPQRSPLNKYKPQGLLSQIYAITNRHSCIYKRGVISSREEKVKASQSSIQSAFPRQSPSNYVFRSLPVRKSQGAVVVGQSCDANFTHVTAHATTHGFSSSTKTFTLRA